MQAEVVVPLLAAGKVYQKSLAQCSGQAVNTFYAALWVLTAQGFHCFTGALPGTGKAAGKADVKNVLSRIQIRAESIFKVGFCYLCSGGPFAAAKRIVEIWFAVLTAVGVVAVFNSVHHKGHGDYGQMKFFHQFSGQVAGCIGDDLI